MHLIRNNSTHDAKDRLTDGWHCTVWFLFDKTWQSVTSWK